MIVRPYSESDFAEVKALHAKQGLAYELPDLESPTMLVRAVIEEDAKITHAGFLRKTAETYWIFDPQQTRRERLGRLLILHKELTPSARRMGLEDIHCWIPPEIVTPQLEGAMMRMGWVKPLWTCFSRKVG